MANGRDAEPAAGIRHRDATDGEAHAWHRVCGVDEAGRGPLAGPVVSAAVILPREFACEEIADSKLMTPEARERVAARLFREAVVSVACAGPATIDRINIRRAALWTMRRALAGLPFAPDVVLFDGNDVPEGVGALGFAFPSADRMSRCVAAASIVAKVVRDDLMTRLGERLPGYGFERHKGYGTAEHRAALELHGPSAHHRLSFRPVGERAAQLAAV